VPKRENHQHKGNIYDRIFRENAEQLFIPLIAKLFNLKIVSYKALQVKFTQTTESEVDFLYEIIQEDQSKFILHIEFQSTNDPTMLERMQEYHSKIFKKFKLPVKPLVVNLSKKAFTAPTQLKPEEIFTGYEVINLFELSTDELLSAQIPEVVIIALLSNYPAGEIESVLQLIVKKLKQIVNTEKDLRRYVTQLLLLSRLRNFEIQTGQILNNMPITYDIEKDGLYLKGIAKGRSEGETKGFEKGLAEGIIICHEMGLPVEQIANKFKVSIEKAQQIISSYKKN